MDEHDAPTRKVAAPPPAAQQTPAQKRASRKYTFAMRVVLFLGALTVLVMAVPLAVTTVATNAAKLGYDSAFAVGLLWMMVTVGLGYSSINTLQKVGLAVANLVAARKAAK